MGAIEDIERLVGGMVEVDGIPLVFGRGDYTRIGLFSVKEQEYDLDSAHESDDLNMVLHMEWFEDTSPLEFGAFDDYDTARLWSHP